MSEALAIRSEILKLARLLERDPESLSYLEQVPAEDIRAVRELATERMFDAGGGVLSRIALASKVIPTGLMATLTQRTFGPMLTARIAGEVDPSRAVEVAAKLPPPFLADVAIELDPRRAETMIGQLPATLLSVVTAELIRREEYVTLGRFVGHITPDALRAALDSMTDSDLLAVAFVLEEKSALDGLVDELGLERLEGVLAAAAAEGQWPEALDLFANLSGERAELIARATAGAEAQVLESLFAAADEHELWGVLLPMLELLGPEDRARMEARLPEAVQPSASEVRSKP
ncbi:MAG TPA: hypothetical protein VMD48_06960 [Solirubrobacteraceae bacterium]|nr:hypothetical protein [Solirubrobacteraceae bacterium]